MNSPRVESGVIFLFREFYLYNGGMMNENYNTPNRGCCGRPFPTAPKNKCNYNDCCMNEYAYKQRACIRNKQPDCEAQAVIPSITVETVDGISNLANCLVHVMENNTTYYVDDKHRILITWAGPVNIPGYDMEGNPNNYKNQIVTDVEAETAVIYDNHGKGFIFGITPESLQQAVNDKLDEMATDGTLENLIAEYIEGAVLGFDTVADMINASNLFNGSFARTLGYRAKNDGGAGLYKIRTITNNDTADGGSIIEMADNSLVAELIVDGKVVPEQFGAYGDGVHDDIAYLNACRNYCTTNHITMGGLSDSVYAISTGFDILTGCSYDFNLATFKALNAMTYVIRQHRITQVHTDPVLNETTKNIVIDCDGKANYGFYQDILGWSVYTDNIRVYNPVLIGIYIKTGQIRLYNSKVETLLLPSTCIGMQVDSSDSEYYNIVIRDCSTAVKVTASHNTFNEIHPALFNNTRANSRAFEIGDANEFVNCYADTFQYGIVCSTDNGFSTVNFRCVVDPGYYNSPTNPVNARPEAVHFTTNSIDSTKYVSMYGTYLDPRKVYGEEYLRFTNVSDWNGGSLRLNNPKMNNHEIYSLPRECRQHMSTTQLNTNDYMDPSITANRAAVIVNGNTLFYNLDNVVLPAINADATQLMFSNLPAKAHPNNTIAKTVVTKAGVICKLQFTTDGRIRLIPYTNITAGDIIDIYESVVI